MTRLIHPNQAAVIPEGSHSTQQTSARFPAAIAKLKEMTRQSSWETSCGRWTSEPLPTGSPFLFKPVSNYRCLMASCRSATNRNGFAATPIRKSAKWAQGAKLGLIGLTNVQNSGLTRWCKSPVLFPAMSAFGQSRHWWVTSRARPRAALWQAEPRKQLLAVRECEGPEYLGCLRQRLIKAVS
jgi:hypothetical protein